jgi:hypothetical protein
MKTLPTRRFMRDFARVRREPCTVTDSGKVIGTWTPVKDHPEPVNFARRVRDDFARPLPFTGAELLRAGKKR